MIKMICGLFKKAMPKPKPLMCEVMDHSMCPVCRTKGALMAGPQGGMSTNAMCSKCGTRINVTPFIPHIDWVHGPQPDIWWDTEQSIFPTEEQIETAKTRIINKT